MCVMDRDSFEGVKEAKKFSEGLNIMHEVLHLMIFQYINYIRKLDKFLYPENQLKVFPLIPSIMLGFTWQNPNNFLTTFLLYTMVLL